jgi:dCTP deaminase
MKGRHVTLASDRTIKWLLKDGQLRVEPAPDDDTIQPSSVDVHLHRYFRRFTSRYTVVDPAVEQPDMTILEEVPEGGVFALNPGEFALGSVLQRIQLSSSIAAQIDGRSSVGRMGLLVHATAGWIDAGFEGHITLELKNLLPDKKIWLYPGMKIAQLLISNLSEPAARPYGDPGRKSSYQHQDGEPVPSAIWRNWNLVSTNVERKNA